MDSGETALRMQAIEEIRNDIEPSLLEAINVHPRLLIGDTVPSVKAGGAPEVLKTSEDARDWQEAVRGIITEQVTNRTSALMNDARPLLGTLQDSVNLFRSNRDLIPGTAEYNPQLAKQFIEMTKAYLFVADGKPLGWRVDVQPILDSIRQSLGAAAPTARQEQVASQPRATDGKWDAPQAGIPSRTGSSGAEEEDYSAFWKTVGMSDMNL